MTASQKDDHIATDEHPKSQIPFDMTACRHISAYPCNQLGEDSSACGEFRFDPLASLEATKDD